MLSSEKETLIVNKIKETVDKLNSIYHFAMIYPHYDWEVSGTSAGVARYKTMSVHFNKKLALTNWVDFINNTIPHEVCHVAVWHWAEFMKKPFPKAHGATWKLMMWEVGAQAKRTHDYDVSEVKRNVKIYEYSCGCENKIEVSARVHNKIQEGSTYRCRVCNQFLKNGMRKLTKSFSRESPNKTTKTIET